MIGRMPMPHKQATSRRSNEPRRELQRRDGAIAEAFMSAIIFCEMRERPPGPSPHAPPGAPRLAERTPRPLWRPVGAENVAVYVRVMVCCRRFRRTAEGGGRPWTFAFRPKKNRFDNRSATG